MKKLFTLMLFIGTTCYLSAQDTTILQRNAYKQSLAVDKNSIFEQEVPASSYVYPDKTIQIYPGETIYIEVSLKGFEIVDFRAVTEIKDSSSTMILNLKQVSEDGEHKNMMLTISNPFDKKLSYHALMSTLRNKNWVATDVLPIEGKLSGIEMWPDLILSLALGGWKFQN